MSSEAAPRARIPRAPLATKVGLAALESLARVSVPASVLLLSRGSSKVAAIASAVALVAALGRGFAVSFAIERALRGTFGAVVDAALRLALVDLRAERRIGPLAEAAREAAVYEATTVPLLAAHVIAIALTWGALAAVLGPLWPLAIAGAAAPLVIALGLGARRIRAAQQAAWDAFADLAIDLRVLVEACVELRAHDRERSFAEGLASRAGALARAERRASVWSAGLSALPSAVVLVSAATPIGGRLGAIVADATGVRTAEIAIVAGAALYFTLGLGKLMETRARYAPFRAALEAFLAAAARNTAAGAESEGGAGSGGGAESGGGAGSGGGAAAPSLANATIELRGVSCRHPHATRATPRGVTFTWRAGRGLLLAGENGAGKSTLVLALLGLLSPSEGSIDIDGAPLDAERARAVRSRCAYLSQSPFVEPGASVAWHLRLLAQRPADDSRIDAALRRVGLWRVLTEHAARSEAGASLAPRDVPVGELSGGERQRMHIARVLVHEADLVILDEPEAGLDRQARTEMAALFDELARERRVLVIAHDAAIVPPSFDRLDIRPDPRDAAEP